jgi:hypothetical protein
MEIFKLLDRSPIVTGYEVIEYKIRKYGGYFNLKIHLNNNTFLYVREYLDEFSLDYPYHWERNNHELIVRWDNSEHHKHLNSFPHHKPFRGNILESYEITLEEVLEYIEITKIQ